MMHYIESNKKEAPAALAARLLEMLEPFSGSPVFLCIGSDRVTGDSLGPMIGSSLSEKLPGVFGTLEHPVHALNLEDTIAHIQKYYSRHPLVAIDASLGSREHLGYITVAPGSLAPGAGVNKALGDIGDISITGIIGTSGPFSHITLQTTRLSAVIPVAKQIALGICMACRCQDCLSDGVSSSKTPSLLASRTHFLARSCIPL